jgi:lactoylglutathione lyase
VPPLRGLEMMFYYTGIRVKDMDESIAFYTDIMGMKLLERSKIVTTKGEVASLNSPGSDQILELNCYAEGSPYAFPYVVGEGLDHLAFKVDDVKKTVEDMRNRGVTIALEPFVERSENGATGTLAYIEDPNGIWLELFQ